MTLLLSNEFSPLLNNISKKGIKKLLTKKLGNINIVINTGNASNTIEYREKQQKTTEQRLLEEKILSDEGIKKLKLLFPNLVTMKTEKEK